MVTSLLFMLVAMTEAQDGGRVFLTREEVSPQGRGGQEGVVCTSLPGLEPLNENLYFACTCSDQATKAKFSLASFAHHLSPSIFSRQLVVDFRDCWALDLTMDQLELSRMGSHRFRPDLQFMEINIENMYQVRIILTLLSGYKPRLSARVMLLCVT